MTKNYVLSFIGIYVVVIIIAFFFNVGLGFGLLLSLFLGIIIYYYTLNQSYEGEIIELKDSEYYKTDDPTIYHNKQFILKLNNGKTKKIAYNTAWKVGDKIKKVKGETAPKKI